MFKVLIVEDEPDLLEIYKMEFELCGAEVYHSSELDSALTIAKKKCPDVICLDLLLNQREIIGSADHAYGGYVLLEKLKANKSTKDIKVIICSNFDTQEDRDLSIKKGACAYVVKSEIIPSDLVNIVKKILNQN